MNTRPDLSARSLRAALHYFSATLQSQDALITARRQEMGALVRESARRQAEIEMLKQAVARSDAENTRLAQALAQPSRLCLALRHPVRALRYVLRTLWQALRPPSSAALASAEVPVAEHPSWMSAVAPLPFACANLADHRERMRTMRAADRWADLRTLVVLAPPAMREAGAAIERGLAGTGLRCTVRATMPDRFDDALYLVVDPGAFAQLPPADRRIVWLVDPAVRASAMTDGVLAALAASLAIFDASLTRIQALQQRGIALQQTFYVPLAPEGRAEAALADDSPLGLRHLLPRALHGCGLLGDAAFERATRGTRLDAEHIVLCLPESLARFESVLKGLRPGAVPFPGLRHLDGWKGTALSYRFLARRARAAGRTRLIVSEDDAGFDKDFDARLSRTLAYLDAHAGSWDLFSGLITDLSERAEVKGVELCEGDLFVRLDSVVGMVFGIYGPQALEALAAYRLEGEDAMRHTIDRYLEALAPRCVTLFPPLVRHDDGFDSTLWMPEGKDFASNESMNPMIHRSQVRIVSKIGAWLERAARGPVSQGDGAGAGLRAEPSRSHDTALDVHGTR